MNGFVRASIRAAARVANLVPNGNSLASGLEIFFAQVQGIGYVASMEEESSAALRCIHSPAPVVLDVGANLGDWSRSLLRHLSPQARIFAFDPQPTNIKALQSIGDSRLTVVPLAMADFEGTATLHTPEPGSGMGSLFDFRPPSTHPVTPLAKEPIQVTTLDVFVKQHQIASIDYMKMDMEGCEYAALQGGMESLKGGVVRALSFEFGQCNIASKTYLIDFWYLLNSLSFTLNLIGPNGVLVPIRDYSEHNEVLRHSNFVAIHNGSGYRRTGYNR